MLRWLRRFVSRNKDLNNYSATDVRDVPQGPENRQKHQIYADEESVNIRNVRLRPRPTVRNKADTVVSRTMRFPTLRSPVAERHLSSQHTVTSSENPALNMAFFTTDGPAPVPHQRTTKQLNGTSLGVTSYAARCTLSQNLEKMSRSPSHAIRISSNLSWPLNAPLDRSETRDFGSKIQQYEKQTTIKPRQERTQERSCHLHSVTGVNGLPPASETQEGKRHLLKATGCREGDRPERKVPVVQQMTAKQLHAPSYGVTSYAARRILQQYLNKSPSSLLPFHQSETTGLWAEKKMAPVPHQRTTKQLNGPSLGVTSYAARRILLQHLEKMSRSSLHEIKISSDVSRPLNAPLDRSETRDFGSEIQQSEKQTTIKPRQERKQESMTGTYGFPYTKKTEEGKRHYLKPTDCVESNPPEGKPPGEREVSDLRKKLRETECDKTVKSRRQKKQESMTGVNSLPFAGDTREGKRHRLKPAHCMESNPPEGKTGCDKTVKPRRQKKQESTTGVNGLPFVGDTREGRRHRLKPTHCVESDPAEGKTGCDKTVKPRRQKKQERMTRANDLPSEGESRGYEWHHLAATHCVESDPAEGKPLYISETREFDARLQETGNDKTLKRKRLREQERTTGANDLPSEGESRGVKWDHLEAIDCVESDPAEGKLFDWSEATDLKAKRQKIRNIKPMKPRLNRKTQKRKCHLYRTTGANDLPSEGESRGYKWHHLAAIDCVESDPAEGKPLGNNKTRNSETKLQETGCDKSVKPRRQKKQERMTGAKDLPSEAESRGYKWHHLEAIDCVESDPAEGKPLGNKKTRDSEAKLQKTGRDKSVKPRRQKKQERTTGSNNFPSEEESQGYEWYHLAAIDCVESDPAEGKPLGNNKTRNSEAKLQETGRDKSVKPRRQKKQERMTGANDLASEGESQGYEWYHLAAIDCVESNPAEGKPLGNNETRNLGATLQETGRDKSVKPRRQKKQERTTGAKYLPSEGESQGYEWYHLAAIDCVESDPAEGKPLGNNETRDLGDKLQETGRDKSVKPRRQKKQERMTGANSLSSEGESRGGKRYLKPTDCGKRNRPEGKLLDRSGATKFGTKRPKNGLTLSMPIAKRTKLCGSLRI